MSYRQRIRTDRTVIAVTPTINTSAYSAGDAVGGLQTLTDATAISDGVAKLTSLSVLDLGNQKAALTILFFNSEPTAATITNNSAFAWSTDTAKFIGKVNVGASDYETLGGEAIYTATGLSLLLQSSGSANLYAAVVTTGTPTYTGTSDLVFRYGFEQQ